MAWLCLSLNFVLMIVASSSSCLLLTTTGAVLALGIKEVTDCLSQGCDGASNMSVLVVLCHDNLYTDSHSRYLHA